MLAFLLRQGTYLLPRIFIFHSSLMRVQQQRECSIEMGIQLMNMCDEVSVYGFNITEGMHFELNHAKKKGIPIRFYDDEMNLVNTSMLPLDDRATTDYIVVVESLHL